MAGKGSKDMEENTNHPHPRPRPRNPRKFRSTRSWMIALLATLAAVGPVGLCSADPPQYEVLILDLPDYAMGVAPWGINDKAQIAGTYRIYYGDVSKPFLWEKGQFIPLDLPSGYVQADCRDINASGEITGALGGYVMPTTGFLIRDGEWVDLGILEGGNFSRAAATNDLGQVVGEWGDYVDADPPTQAFIWEDGIMTNLGPDFPAIKSRVGDINNSSQITGQSGADFNFATAFIWEDGNVLDLGPVPGGSASVGRAINDRGDVAGQGSGIGFYYRDGQMVDLGLVPGSTRCHVTDMNNSGEVLGYCEEYPNGPGRWAYVWRNGTMSVLEDCVPPELNLELKSTYGINNAGQITATGQMGLESVSVLLTPINPRPADVNRDGFVDIDDLFEVLGDWGQCPDEPQVCPADLNCDGTVTLADIVLVVENWGKGG